MKMKNGPDSGWLRDGGAIRQKNDIKAQLREQMTQANGEYVKSLYKELLGREPDLDGYHNHMKALEKGTVTREGLRQAFLEGSEFQERLAKLNKLEADQSAIAGNGTSKEAFIGGGDVPLPPGAGQPAATDRLDNGLAVNRKTVTPGPVPLEGYDSGKLNNQAVQTVKYQFGRVASNWKLDSVKDMASAEALLKQMTPQLKEAGLNIKDVKTDKILVETELGDEWVDVIRGAGSGSPGWWWGSEGRAVPGTEKGVKATGPAAAEPGAPLRTVPLLPEYTAGAQVLKDAMKANPGMTDGQKTKLAAEWVKQRYPQFMPVGDDRATMYKAMTVVIGVLRSAGIDAHRVVNHPSREEGNPGRYGSDAVVVNGRVFDVYRAFGEANEPVDQDVGPYEAGRLRE